MSTTSQVVVIGGGINGLTCAAYLTRGGLSPVILERLDTVGGGARTAEIAPGFRAPILSHSTGPLCANIVDDLHLESHGLEFLRSSSDVVALGEGGRALTLYEDAKRTADSIRAWSTGDAEAWPRFVASLKALGHVISTLFAATPASVDEPAGRDLWALFRTLRAFRALDQADAYRLLRWGPMAVADLVAESFETERLRAAIAADGIFGTRLGPWSAGSGLALLLRAANAAAGSQQSWFVRGGPGAIAGALERIVKSSGSIRTGVAVRQITVKDERVRGVVLSDGTELPARAVISAVDPKQTFLSLCDPGDLAPEFLWRMRNYRAHGTVAKLNLALSALPKFTGVDQESMGGRIRIAPEIDYLERAFDHSKYGRFSPEPYIEMTVPSVLDPSLTRNGGHVLSAYVQFAPYALREGSWDERREEFAKVAIDTIERHAPGLGALIVARQVITPLDLERDYGMTGGHIFHGELALDQMLTMRPLLGWGQYKTPIRDLYLCGSGTHPGTGLTGRSGANAAREILRSLR